MMPIVGVAVVLCLWQFRSQVFAAQLGEAVPPAFMVIVATCAPPKGPPLLLQHVLQIMDNVDLIIAIAIL